MKAYFKVHPGPTFDILKRHTDKHMEANAACCAWAKSHNLPLEGIRHITVWFKDGITPDPKAWKKGKKGGYLPRCKTPEGLVLANELKALPPFPDWMSLISDLTKGREVEIMRINSTGTPGIRKDKADAFYRLHIDTYWLPEDRTGLEEIKASEYESESP